MTTPNSSSVKEALKKIQRDKALGIQQRVISRSEDISDFYEFMEKIGEGSFGKVYKARQKDTDKLFAIKLLYKKQMANKSEIITEIENLKKLDHPNVIRLYEYFETK